jgi:hypothetical protein
MDAIATLIAVGVLGYAAIGLIVALAFVAIGVTMVQSAPVTVGARALLVPAAAVLWPLILLRWLQARRVR